MRFGQRADTVTLSTVFTLDCTSVLRRSADVLFLVSRCRVLVLIHCCPTSTALPVRGFSPSCVQVAATSSTRAEQSARMGLAPSKPSGVSVAGTVVTTGPDGRRLVKAAFTNGACAASFTSTEMDVVTVNAAKEESDKDREAAR